MSDDRFYVTGGVLREKAQSYVRRQADIDLFEALSRCDYCYVLTPRQMGKSSLMVRTRKRLEDKKGIAVANVDLQLIGQNLSADQWYSGMLRRMAKRLKLEEEIDAFWQSHDKIAPLERWIQAIQEVILTRIKTPVVIFIDEIDNVRSLPFSRDEFFAGIRALYNLRATDPELNRLSFCLLGVSTPSDLIQDSEKTPFNIGRRIELNDFTESEAATLAKGLGRPEKVGKHLLKRILYWTGGHPYLTQRLCEKIAGEPSVKHFNDVDRVCKDLFLSDRAKDEDNLAHVSRPFVRPKIQQDQPVVESPQEENRRASLLTKYLQVRSYHGVRDGYTNKFASALSNSYRWARGQKGLRDDDIDPLANALRLSGITKTVKGHLCVRNRIYYYAFDRMWVTNNMPGEELRRQQAAYKEGRWRAIAYAGIVILVIGSFLVYALVQRAEALTQKKKADENAQEITRKNSELEKANLEIEKARKETEVQNAALSASNSALNIAIGEKEAAIERAELQAKEAKKQAERAKELAKEAKKQAKRAEELAGDATVLQWMAEYTADLADLRAENLEDAIKDKEDAKRDAIKKSDFLSASTQAAEAANLLDTDPMLGVVKSLYSVSELYQKENNPVTKEGLEVFEKALPLSLHALSIKDDANVESLGFSEDGNYLTTANAEGFYNKHNLSPDESPVSPGILKRIQPPPDEAVTRVAVSPDGNLIAIGTNNGRIRYKQVDSDPNAPPIELKGHGFPVKSLTFSNEKINYKPATGHRLLASSSVFWSSSVKDVDRNKRLWRKPGILGWPSIILGSNNDRLVNSMAFSKDGMLVATGRDDGTTEIRDIKNGKLKLKLLGTREAQRKAQKQAAKKGFAPYGKSLAQNNSAQSRNEDRCHRNEGHKDGVINIAFNPKRDRVVTVGRDKMAKVWDLSQTNYADVLSPLYTLCGHDDAIVGVSFNLNGDLIATSGQDGKVILWDARDKAKPEGRKLVSLTGHNGYVNAVAFDPKGERLATASSDKTAKLWNFSSIERLEQLRSLLKSIETLRNTVRFEEGIASGLNIDKLMDDAWTFVRTSLTEKDCERFWGSPRCPSKLPRQQDAKLPKLRGAISKTEEANQP